MFISILFCQKQLDMLIHDVLSGSKDSAAIYLPVIEKQYPNNPNMLFLKGLMETNGEEAMEIFVKLYSNHPTSDYGDDAVMKVSEYYYASGLYVQSAEWLKKMPLFYSRSEHIERAIKLFMNSLIVSGNKDTAIFYSKVFKRQFPSLDVDEKINNLLEDYKNSQKISKKSIDIDSVNKQTTSRTAKSAPSAISKIDKNSKKYSLQSGAFGLKKNAENQKIFLKSMGFDARIAELYRQTKTLYIVRIGYYESKQEAEDTAKTIKSTLDLSTIIIVNE